MSQRPSLWSAAWWNTAPPPWRASRRPACSASPWKTRAVWKPKWPSGTRRSGKGALPADAAAPGDRALLYLFRPARLQQDLDQPGARSLLARYGYRAFQAEEALAQLQTRLREQGGFPHEIGLFLGYPLGDVAGFIRNRGKNCKCSGCWKVYCNELEAQKRFAQIQKCRQVYTRLWTQGRSLWQLTVAA